MPSTLRDDLLHPVRVAHASLHQAAANAEEQGMLDLRDELLGIAQQTKAIVTGQEAPKPAPKLTPRKAAPAPQQDLP